MVDEAPNPELESIGPFRVLSHLAKGGTAKIDIAFRSNDPQIYVVKQLRVDANATLKPKKRLLREAQLIALLNHPNIARIEDAGLEEDRVYIAMHYVAGVDLNDLIKRSMREKHPIPWPVILEIALQTLDGLAYAHDFTDSQGKHLRIVHRDLSTRNIMVDVEGRIKIIDFGIAKADFEEVLTTPGAILGTPRYMSPEQVLREPIDHRSDLYTLSAVLYELLTNRPVVTKTKLVQALKEVVKGAPPPVRSLRPDVPESLVKAIEKGLSKSADDRFQTAQAFKHALAEVAQSAPQAPSKALAHLLHQWYEPARLIAERLRLQAAARVQLDTNMMEPTRLDPQHATQNATVELLMPTTPLRPMPGRPAPDRSHKRAVVALLALTLVGGLIVALLFYRSKQRSFVSDRPKVTIAPIVTPKARVTPRPAPTPSVRTATASTPPPVRKRAPRQTRRTRKANARTERDYSTLRAQLKALESSFNKDAMDRFCKALQRRIARDASGRSARQSLQEKAMGGCKLMDINLLKQALEALEAQPPKPTLNP